MVVENVPTVVGACCILHNICQIHGDTFNEEWLQDIPNTGTITRPANRPVFSGTIPEIQAVSRCPECLFENPGV